MTEHYVTCITTDGPGGLVWLACRCGWLLGASQTAVQVAWGQHRLVMEQAERRADGAAEATKRLGWPRVPPGPSDG